MVAFQAGQAPAGRGLSRRGLGRCLGALALAWAIAAAAAGGTPTPADPPVPASAFFSPPVMSRPVLSPDGEKLAVHVTGADGRRRLAVVSVAPPHQVAVVAGFADADIEQVQWVNDTRLVFDVDDNNAAWAEQHASGLFAVNADGSGLRTLIRRRWDAVVSASAVGSRELDADHQLLRVLRDGSADVAIARWRFDGHGELQAVWPLRLNTVSGLVVPIEANLPRPALGWRIDPGGVARVASMREGGRTEVLWRPAADAPWAVVGSGDTYGLGRGVVNPLPIGADGALYTAIDAAGDGELLRFDATEQRLEPTPLLSIKGFGFQGRLLYDARRHRLIGARYTSDARGTAWFDPRLAEAQARVDRQLPGRVNLLDPAECGCSRWMVVTSYSDRQPEQYYLYDSEADLLDPVGASRPAIDARRMAERDFVRISARDGRPLPVHLTRPAGPPPWPTVVLVHGGPFVRGGEWQWDADSQFLASRGYLVIEPEFRGSTGYGVAHFRAGWRQWGLAMQDDIADATRWAIAQGQADGHRVCIAGASYGGYATLMGLVRDADLYRCGVAWAAVTDLRLLYDLTDSDLPEVYRRHGLPRLLGDRQKDAERLAATSPLAQAARITRPLLLVHGGEDRRVPREHATRLRDALLALKRPLQWHEYRDEGHGFHKPDNRVDFMLRMERFLAEQLAAP